MSDDDEIAMLRAMDERNVDAQRAKARRALIDRAEGRTWPKDHACGRCVPGGEIVRTGYAFTCAHHRVEDLAIRDPMVAATMAQHLAGRTDYATALAMAVVGLVESNLSLFDALTKMHMRFGPLEGLGLVLGTGQSDSEDGK